MRFLFANPPLKRKSRVFVSQIPHLSENHAFSLLKSPIEAKITLFLFANPPFNQKITRFLFENPTFKKKSRVFSNPPLKRKSRVFSLQIPHDTRKSRVCSSEIPHLSENHAFSLRESNIYAKITRFLKSHIDRKSVV